MAVKGKKGYMIYLDEENVEFLQNHFVSRKGSGGLSLFIDKYLARTVFILKNNPDAIEKIKPGKLTFKSAWQLLKLQFRIAEEQANCDIEAMKATEDAE